MCDDVKPCGCEVSADLNVVLSDMVACFGVLDRLVG